MLLLTSGAFAQSLYNSPYSRFRYGQFADKTNTFQMGQGGLRYTTRQFNQVNTSNPASYSSIRRYSPVFDMSVTGHLFELKTDNNSQLYRNGTISNFTLGLPTSKRSGFVISYQPFAKMGYNVVDSLSVSGENYANTYNGDGGLNQLIGGFSYLIYQADSANFTISLGLNGGYVFGNFTHQQNSSFENGSVYNSVLKKDSTGVKDGYLEFGLLSTYGINKNTELNIGIVYTLGQRLNAQNQNIVYTYAGNISSVIDTMRFNALTNGTIDLPAMLGIAAELDMSRKMGLGLQYTMQNWSNYSTSFLTESNVEHTLAKEINLGWWYKPSGAKGNPNGGAWKNATFKAGARYGTLGTKINGTDINELGISTGVHLPLVNSGSFSSLNFGTEFGQRGTTTNGLLQESYIRFRLGIAFTPNINDRWFVKRKYN